MDCKRIKSASLILLLIYPSSSSFSYIHHNPHIHHAKRLIFTTVTTTTTVLRSSANEATHTRYTITDSICPPTDPETLYKVVRKHCHTFDDYIKNRPIAVHTLKAFEYVQRYIQESSEELNDGIVLDSGCGTGRSTLLLAKQNPNNLVIGIDRSHARLHGNKPTTTISSSSSIRTIPNFPNAIFVRADLPDFWRCCWMEKWNIYKHYLLYPNPYPKKSRLKHRWYAHPSFPLLLLLDGSELVLRSNWATYVNEFQQAILIANDDEEGEKWYIDKRMMVPFAKSAASAQLKQINWEEYGNMAAMTNFEQKYKDCGEPVYEIVFKSDGYRGEVAASKV